MAGQETVTPRFERVIQSVKEEYSDLTLKVAAMSADEPAALDFKWMVEEIANLRMEGQR